MSYLSQADDYTIMNESINPFSVANTKIKISGAAIDESTSKQSQLLKNSTNLQQSKFQNDRPDVDIVEMAPYIVQDSTISAIQRENNNNQINILHNGGNDQNQLQNSPINVTLQQRPKNSIIEQLELISPSVFEKQTQIDQLQQQIDINQLRINQVVSQSKTIPKQDTESKIQMLQQRFSKFSVKPENKAEQMQTAEQNIPEEHSHSNNIQIESTPKTFQNDTLKSPAIHTSPSVYQGDQNISIKPVQQQIIENTMHSPLIDKIDAATSVMQFNSDQQYQNIVQEQFYLQNQEMAQLKLEIQSNQCQIQNLTTLIQKYNLNAKQISYITQNQQFLDVEQQSNQINVNDVYPLPQQPNNINITQQPTDIISETISNQSQFHDKPSLKSSNIVFLAQNAQMEHQQGISSSSSINQCNIEINIPYYLKHGQRQIQVTLESDSKLQQLKQQLDMFINECKQDQNIKIETAQQKANDATHNENIPSKSCLEKHISNVSVDKQNIDENDQIRRFEKLKIKIGKIEALLSQEEMLYIQFIKNLIFKQQKEQKSSITDSNYHQMSHEQKQDFKKNLNKRIQTLIQQFSKMNNEGKNSAKSDNVQTQVYLSQNYEPQQTKIKQLRTNKNYEQLKQKKNQTHEQQHHPNQCTLSQENLLIYYYILKQQYESKKKLERERSRNLCFDELQCDIDDNDVNTLLHSGHNNDRLETPICKFQLVDPSNIISSFGDHDI